MLYPMEECLIISSSQGSGLITQVSVSQTPAAFLRPLQSPGKRSSPFVGSEDSWRLWGTSEEGAITGLLDHLKEVAIDWSSASWDLSTT
eukprot:5504706-Amphidinium_carterae.3